MQRAILRNEYEWYLAQAENPENTPHQRDLWRQLAAELAPRVADIEATHEPLWKESPCPASSRQQSS